MNIGFVTMRFDKFRIQMIIMIMGHEDDVDSPIFRSICLAKVRSSIPIAISTIGLAAIFGIEVLPMCSKITLKSEIFQIFRGAITIH